MHRFWNSSGSQKVSLLGPIFCAVIAALILAGCGSSTSRGAGSGAGARSLLAQTFTGRHDISSGQLQASLSLDPTGSTVLTQPLTLSLGGPFQSRGKHAVPASDFTIGIGFQGHTGQLGILSTGTAGFVTLEGTAYKLPAASFRQLESGGVSAVGGGSSGSSSVLSGLGIHPQRWLVDPTVIGTAEVGGTQTDHIHGRLALTPLLADLSTLLAKASTAGSSASALKAISPAEQQKIAGEVSHASFDLWTGATDHTIRKLTVTLPASGTISSDLGGLSRVTLSFTLAYSDIGRPQTVTAPAGSQPYSQFQTRLRSVVVEIEELIAGASGSTTTSSGASTSGSAGVSSGVTAYSQCVSAAGRSVSELQKCAALLNGTSSG